MVAKQTTSTPAGSPANRTAARAKAPAPRRPSMEATRRVGTASIVSFFQESRAELRKVTWPTRQETMNLTGAVIAMTVGMAAFLGIVDEVLNYLVKPVLGAK